MVRFPEIFLLGVLVLASYINLCYGRCAVKRHVTSIPAAVNKFSSNFYQKLAEKHEGNLVCSPLSLYLTLGMVAQGAGGETRDQLESKLNLPSISNYNQNFKNLLETLDNEEGTKIGLANRLFVHSPAIKQSFKDVLATYFKSEISYANPNSNSVDEINNWCAEKTEGRIRDIVTEDDLTNAQLVLINALYFKGEWMNQFTNIEHKPFHINGTEHPLDVEMMTVDDSYLLNYYSSEILDANFIELPYRIRKYSNKYSCSMFVFRPRKFNGLKTLEQNLHNFNFNDLPTPRKREMKPMLPKFNITNAFDLVEVLRNMGLNNIFDKSADFSNMANQDNLRISKIKQKVFIDVNEYGTEAAAVSVGGASVLAFSTTYNFNVNRPFLSVIVHKSTGIPLFYIRVKDLPIVAPTVIKTTTPKIILGGTTEYTPLDYDYVVAGESNDDDD